MFLPAHWKASSQRGVPRQDRKFFRSSISYSLLVNNATEGAWLLEQSVGSHAWIGRDPEYPPLLKSKSCLFISVTSPSMFLTPQLQFILQPVHDPRGHPKLIRSEWTPSSAAPLPLPCSRRLLRGSFISSHKLPTACISAQSPNSLGQSWRQ